jgi:hypothetical protein
MGFPGITLPRIPAGAQGGTFFVHPGGNLSDRMGMKPQDLQAFHGREPGQDRGSFPGTPGEGGPGSPVAP